METVHFILTEETHINKISANHYSQILQDHHTRIKNKRPCQLTDDKASSCCKTVPIPMWSTDF